MKLTFCSLLCRMKLIELPFTRLWSSRPSVLPKLELWQPSMPDLPSWLQGSQLAGLGLDSGRADLDLWLRVQEGRVAEPGQQPAQHELEDGGRRRGVRAPAQFAT